MPLNKPYPKIFRFGPTRTLGPFFDDRGCEAGINNLSSYELLKNDLKQIFEFIEPCEQNNTTFSHRNFELLLRACTEVESLCKQIFVANGHKLKSPDIRRYSDLNGAMQLSTYEVKSYGFLYPKFAPFRTFDSANFSRKDRSPRWYKAYNDVKHNRSNEFAKASLQNVIEAIGGVYVLLVAMYGLGFDHIMKMSWQHFNMVDTPTFFRAIECPSWQEEDQYDYDWETLKTNDDRFQCHPLPVIN